MSTEPQRRIHVSDVDLAPWRHLRLWLFSVGMLLVLYGYAQDPVWVEEVYVDGWGGAVASVLTALTSFVPVSVGEIAIAIAVVWVVIQALTGLSEVGAGRRRWHNALVGGVLHVADIAAVLVAVFYVVWGVSYARAPAVERLGWTELAPAERVSAEDVPVLEDLVRTANRGVNDAYQALHGSLDGPPLTMPREGLDVHAALDAGFDRAGAALALPEGFREARGRTKTPYLSELMSWFGIGGMYMPYSGEANVNGTPPAWSQVSTSAHEMAHQRMIASEEEATFFGFLACMYSDEPLLRYAAWHTARGQLLYALYKADPVSYKALRDELAPGPMRDKQAVWDHWAQYDGKLEELGTAINDTYLKANQVEGGVEAYSRVGRLIVAWMRSEQGRERLASK